MINRPKLDPAIGGFLGHGGTPKSSIDSLIHRMSKGDSHNYGNLQLLRSVIHGENIELHSLSLELGIPQRLSRLLGRRMRRSLFLLLAYDFFCCCTLSHSCHHDVSMHPWAWTVLACVWSIFTSVWS